MNVGISDLSSNASASVATAAAALDVAAAAGREIYRFLFGGATAPLFINSYYRSCSAAAT